jgi:glycosyltransferase involved in cell wall biosynthesis
MKVCLIGPGIDSIPPTGWGAVEIIVWEYKNILEKKGYEVLIINTNNVNEIINRCNYFNPDLVHLHYDVFWYIMGYINCKNKIITSHYGYIDRINKHDNNYRLILEGIKTQSNLYISALSQSNKDVFISQGIHPDRIKVVPNGIREDLFKFSEECEYPDRTICLAKIETRKRQYLIHEINEIDFVGRIVDNRYNRKNYLGEWSKNTLYDNLTNYANLILLSDGEAHALVCIEAMAAGLGLVVSEWACANLDTSKPFIDVITEDRIQDHEYIRQVIKQNRLKSIKMRREIRNYACENFSWEKIISNYIKTFKIEERESL